MSFFRINNYKTKVVTALFIVNLVVFIMQYTIPQSSNWIMLNPVGSENYSVLQYLTACFAHSGIWHILANMIGLLSFGPPLERKYGSKPFLIFYLFVGITANIFYHLMGGDIPALGASGAIFGVLTVFSIVFPEEKVAFLFLGLK